MKKIGNIEVFCYKELIYRSKNVMPLIIIWKVYDFDVAITISKK